MKSTVDFKAAQPVKVSAESIPRAGRFLRRNMGAYRQRLIVFTLLLADVLLALLTWEACTFLWGLLGGEPLTLFGIVPGVAVWVGLRALLGMYPGYGLDHAEELKRQTYASLMALAITSAFALAAGASSMGSLIIVGLVYAALLVLAPVARPFVKRGLKDAGLWGKPVAILGTGATGKQLIKALKREWTVGLKPVAVFDNRLVPEDKVLEGVPYRGSMWEAQEMARDHGVDTVIFAMPHIRRKHLEKFVRWAGHSFQHVIVMPNLSGVTNSSVVARDLAGAPGVEIRHNLLDPWARRIKRALDLSATLLGGLLISPLLLLLVALIRLDSPGPAFYGHRRLGAGGKHFRCWKFRTMHADADRVLEEFLQANPEAQVEWDQNFKLRHDPRVTRIGRFLRKTSLDELPQLWNVLKGEMSLVGPRPIVDDEVSRYGSVYQTYLRIQPGISGFWQVSGRSDTSYAERVKLDAYYVHNWSVWLDIVILARTVHSVLLSRGAY
jgi:Undecaprenyl-phosphate galactose phosphotransferase WbaP